MAIKHERVGERRKANNGMWMTIIAYRNCKDIDVQFEDGTIVCNKNYYSFLKGEIGHPKNNSQSKKERIGEKVMSTCGLEMEIIGYRSMTDIDVRFEDGTVIKNQTYKNFSTGCITPPHLSYKNRHIGEQVNSKHGLITLIKYRKYDDIDVQLEDGTVVTHICYQEFQKGRVRNTPTGRQYNHKPNTTLKKERENEKVRAANGLMMKIKEYRTTKSVDVEFEDGVIVYNKTYENFKKGCVPHPTKKTYTHVGEEKYAYNGLLMKIIGYRNREDLDIEFEDGTILEHKTYKSFLSGHVKHPYISSKKQIVNREGEERLARNGMKMKIKNYRTNDDLDIEFEDGTIVEHKTYQHFRVGNISHPDISLSHVSIPEATILYYLAPLGFIKKNQGYFSKFHPSFGKTEIDIFNEELMMGIEYDGFYFHSGRKNKIRDQKKDESAKKAGILLVRVRENGLLPTNCDNTINILRQCNYDNNELENIIQQILCYISKRSKKQYEINVNIARDYNQIIKLASKISNRSTKANGIHMESRKGETKIANNGLKMTIIDYRKYRDIDVQFENGVVVRGTSYGAFKKGGISCKENGIIYYGNSHKSFQKTKNIVPKYIGEKRMANNGMEMTVVDYRKYNDIDIEFEDGTIVYHKAYNDFLRGKIGNPNIKPKTFYHQKERVGESNIANNEMTMTIVDYHNSKNIDIMFEDGVVVYKKLYKDFKIGNIGHPTIKTKRHSKLKSESIAS